MGISAKVYGGQSCYWLCKSSQCEYAVYLATAATNSVYGAGHTAAAAAYVVTYDAAAISACINSAACSCNTIHSTCRAAAGTVCHDNTATSSDATATSSDAAASATTSSYTARTTSAIDHLTTACCDQPGSSQWCATGVWSEQRCCLGAKYALKYYSRTGESGEAF